MNSLSLIPVPNIPMIQPGDDLADIISAAMAQSGQELLPNDVIIIAQKIVSKAENCFIDLTTVIPSARALKLAALTEKDPRLVEVILWDTAEVIRARPGLLIVQHTAGFISANAGLDRSNIAPEEADVILRLPADSDASARRIRQQLADLTGHDSPVLIIDSHGRPWRIGTHGVVIGLSGLKPVQDLRGQPDLYGIPLKHTWVALGDQLAGAASLVMGQATEACPVVIARGVDFEADEDAVAADVLRNPETDLFR